MMKDINYSEFVNICKMTELDLKEWLRHELLKYYTTVIEEPGYLYARQANCPVLLTAHMDTVHKETVKNVVETKTKKGKHVISSPQGIGGDDRCGIYMILCILKETNIRPAILFCEQEEDGGVGSDIFCNSMYIDELKELKFFIELDRANANDLVFYNDDNQDFYTWCENTTGYKENFGSFSDISNLCPATKVSGVNVSCGYYKAHTLNEYVIWEEMINSIETVKKLLVASEKVDQFEYKEIKYKYSYWNRWDDWDRYGYINTSNKKETYIDTCVQLYISFKESDEETETFIEGKTENECWVTFFINHPTVCFNDVLDWEVYDN